jgi:hypothetical protein
MYRVGIVINENEVSHSRYADTLGALQSALDGCNDNGRRGNSYYFSVLDKFNVHTLFEEGENNIKTFDAIFIATNAMSFNERIHEVFSHNKQIIEEFLDDNKGIFVSSQKKLSNGGLSKDKYKSAGFLPERFDYYLFDRPEKYSSEGAVSISTETNRLLLYPYKISNELIKDHCENNQFIVHTYRSLVIPKYPHSYATVLSDSTSLSVSQKELGYINGDRKVLLSSRLSKRIVISTMALDWANHTELLCNILTFITQSKSLTTFVKKESEYTRSAIIDSYIVRANTANLPYRVISRVDLSEHTRTPGEAFIFSPNWRTGEIENLYASLLTTQSTYFAIYHICRTADSSNHTHKLTKYCNFSSIDVLKDVVIQNLLSSYLSSSWNKSVWTYSYILKVIALFAVDIPVIAKRLYVELSGHFTKRDGVTGKLELTGCYDNVFNATCKMLEILNYFQDRDYDVSNDDSLHVIDDVIQSAEAWILGKIEAGSLVDQDICYCMLYLLKNHRYHSLSDSIKARLTELFIGVLEESLSSKLASRSSIDFCRLYQTLCMIKTNDNLNGKKAVTYLRKIETILKESQDVSGIWKNISDTAEITAMLVETYELRSEFDASMNTINTLIAKGIEILHSQFNPRTSMWSDDLGTTAKAMYAIGAYDKKFSFAINDFFLDLKTSQERKVEATDETHDTVGNLYETIDHIEEQKEGLNRKLLASGRELSVYKMRISKTRNLALVLLAMVLILTVLLGLILGNLRISHKAVFDEIWAGWSAQFIGGFFGLVVGAIAAFLYARLSKNIEEI